MKIAWEDTRVGMNPVSMERWRDRRRARRNRGGPRGKWLALLLVSLSTPPMISLDSLGRGNGIGAMVSETWLSEQ